MISDKRKNLHITVPVEILEALRAYSEATHRSMSQTIVDLVMEHCKLNEDNKKT